MKTLSVYGSSDDLIEMEGIEGADEFNPKGFRDSDDIMASFDVVSGVDGLRIYAIYDGCWSFAVGQTNDSYPLPDWPIRITNEHDYSVRLEIDCPDDARVTQNKVPKDDD